jgi:hypothetical protein
MDAGATTIEGGTFMVSSRRRRKDIVLIPVLLGAAIFAFEGLSVPSFAESDHPNTQIARLYELQAAFHRAATVHDPVNGDSPAVIDQRVRDMVSLWTEDGVLTAGGAVPGNYIGRGDPADPATCPTPSADPNNRGTLCTFFKYVAGSFQPANKFVSLAPSYKTHFDVSGNVASFYFECHYFNVATDPSTGKPLWTAVAHLTLEGTARRVDGTWLLATGGGPPAGIPVP